MTYFIKHDLYQTTSCQYTSVYLNHTYYDLRHKMITDNQHLTVFSSENVSCNIRGNYQPITDTFLKNLLVSGLKCRFYIAHSHVAFPPFIWPKVTLSVAV